jgi:hypothetical protein
MMEDAGCSDSVFLQNYFNTTTDYVSTLWKQAMDTGAAAAYPSATPIGVVGNHKIVLVIGDSTDRIMTSHICELLRGTETNVEPEREQSRPNVCTATLGGNAPTTFVAGYMNIFGMHHTCRNGGTAASVDPRPFNTTADRISVVLEEVLEKIPWNATMPPPDKPAHTPLEVYVQVGSNLWDLSDGCNDQLGVSREYAQQYQQGIAQAHEAIQRSIQDFLQDLVWYDDHGNEMERSVRSHIIWKLAPPISLRYSKRITDKRGGRTRSNQQYLNQLLRETVVADDSLQQQEPSFKLGSGMVDLWSVVKTNMPSEKDLNEELKEDGRHYTKCPNVAFFNSLLQEIHRISLVSESNGA